MRPFRADDFHAATEIGHDAATAQWVPALPAADGPGVAAFFEECRRAGEMLHLVIADRLDDAYLGEVMIALGEHEVGELGCGVVPAARRRGVATEAFGLLADWAIDTLGLPRLQVVVAQVNLPARRLAERTGFRREGVLRSYLDTDGTRHDAVVLSRLPDDPPATPRREAP